MNEAAKKVRQEYNRKYREQNKDHLNEYRRQWNKDNPEKVKQYQAAYWERKASEGDCNDK